MSDLPQAVDLARFQFAFTIAFHIVFPALTIGLASWLALLEGLWLLRRRDVYMRLWRHWSIVFALAFGMGVVSGVVMSYQIGTNWGPFADRTGPVLGPLFAYEVMSAFFLEAGFLGVMLFGRKLVGERLHFAATLMVALGTLASAFWILSANSWMHTPAGFAEVDGQFVPVDWWAIVFNPSFPYRLVHMVLAAYLTAALVVAAASAWQVLRGRDGEASRTALRMAIGMVAVVAPLQLVAGDLHGLNTLRHQPAKIAAMEGHWETQRGAPLILFGWPDMAAERTRWAVGILKAGSFVLTHDPDGEVVGLKAWPRDERPDATLVFWSFRLMVGLGLAMIVTGLLGAVLAWRGRLAAARWYLRGVVAMGPAGFVAILAGWVTTEAGRQPWVVHGLMRTADAVSPVAAPAVASSLAAFALVYLVVFGAGIAYLLRLLARSPDAMEETP
ncbi:MAG: cytochrome ubiquinol oxidase subunit I [Alphaproteobacteria bacterium]